MISFLANRLRVVGLRAARAHKVPAPLFRVTGSSQLTPIPIQDNNRRELGGKPTPRVVR